MTALRLRILSRLAHRDVTLSVTDWRGTYGLDPLTGTIVRRTVRVPPVHASGAFHAYPYGMPDA